MSSPRVRIFRSRVFSAAVRYHDDRLSAEENRESYGALASLEIVGRDFRLEAGFEGPIDPLTGMIVNLTEIDRWLANVTAKLDHHELNSLSEIFLGSVPTTERIACYCRAELEHLIGSTGPVRLCVVRVYEDESVAVTLEACQPDS